MPIVTSFFGVVDLLRGGKILGYSVAIIRCITFMIIMSMILIMPDFESVLYQLKKHAQMKNTGFLEYLFKSHPIAFLYTLASFLGLGICVAVLFILGIYKRMKNYLLPFILFDILSVIFWHVRWIETFLAFVNSFQCGQFIFACIMLVLSSYMLVCSVAVYQHLADFESNYHRPGIETGVEYGIEMIAPNSSSTPVPLTSGQPKLERKMYQITQV